MSDTLEFTTIETFSIARRGTVHIVKVSDDLLNSLDPRTLVDKFVLLDGKLQRVTAIETPYIPWRPGSKAFRNIGLLVRD